MRSLGSAIGLVALSLLSTLVSAGHAHANPSPATPTRPAVPAPSGSGGGLTERTALLAPIQVESLTLTPIVATTASEPTLDVLVLDEAMASKAVKIREVASENVNSLTIANSSDKPVFLLAGEVIIGGKQDRIIGANTVIPAKSSQEVPVFCVEHGRWDNKSKTFTTAKALAHGRLRGQANYAAQGDVWREVSEKNAKRGTRNASDTYRQVAQQQAAGKLGGLSAQVDTALTKISAGDRARMVGYVVALNGAVATVDVFGSPALFKKLEPKLVRSYVTEAVDIAAAANVRPPTLTDVKAFMADADEAREEEAYESRASASKKYSGKKAGKAKVQFKSAPNTKPAASAPSVYENYQAK